MNHVVTAARRKKADDEVIDVAVTAKLGSLFAVVCTQDHIVTDVNIAGLFCSFFKLLLLAITSSQELVQGCNGRLHLYVYVFPDNIRHPGVQGSSGYLKGLKSPGIFSSSCLEGPSISLGKSYPAVWLQGCY